MRYPPTAYDTRFDMQSILATVDITTGPDALARPGQRTLVLDFLDQNLIEILDAITTWVPVVWRGQKLTTLLYQVQNITSAWFITLAFNGVSSPLQLQPGMVLKIPTRTALEQALKSLTASSSTVQPGMTTI